MGETLAAAHSSSWAPVRISLFAPNRERPQRLLHRLRQSLEAVDFDVTPEPYGSDDLVIGIGGDGTFLEALRRYRHLNPVFCGINAGNLGFLQEFDESGADTAVKRLLQRNYSVVEQRLLHASLLLEGTATRHYQAFNEIVIERQGTRALRFHVIVDGFDLGPTIGDGVLVASATGSTAYAYAAGGAIVHPDCEVLQVVLLNPHRTRVAPAFNAPLILPAGAELEVRVDWGRQRRPRIVVDGEEGVIGQGERLRVVRDTNTIRVMRFGLVDFWQRLRTKLISAPHDEYPRL